MRMVMVNCLKAHIKMGFKVRRIVLESISVITK